MSYWLKGKLGLLYNGHERHDKVLGLLYGMLPWSAFDIRHCPMCNCEYHIKGWRALLLLRRFDICARCHKGRTRPITEEELNRCFYMPDGGGFD